MKTPRSKRRRWISWALLGLLAYGMSLVALLPAAMVWDQLSERKVLPAGVAAQGVSGTIWSGSMVRLTLPGDLAVSETNWVFRPGRLFTGRLAWSLTGRLPGGQIGGQFALSPGGMQITAARGDFDAGPVVTPWLRYPVVIKGRVAVDLERLSLTRDGLIREARGALGWLDAAAGLPEALPLGDLRGELADDGAGGLRISIRDQGGPLIAEGVVTLASGAYRVDGTAGTREGAHAHISQTLRMIGNPGRDGRVAIRLSGSL